MTFSPLPKAMARVQGQTVRQRLSAAQKIMYDEAIVAGCQQSFNWGEYRRVQVFLPIERHREIDMWPLVHWLWEEHPGVAVYVPRVAGDSLEQVAVTPVTQFRRHAWGMDEPVAGPVLEPATRLDLILAPLLAFDAQGHRVGYGRGFYDRWLAQQSARMVVGLVYAGGLVAAGIAAEPHDVSLDGVVTERGLRWFSRAGRPG